MFIDQKSISVYEIKHKSFLATIILILLFLVLFFAFWNIQVLQNEKFKLQASKNILKELVLKAPRGLIKDRNNKILSENKLHFSLFLTREDVTDIKKTIQFAIRVTGYSEQELQRRIDKYKNFPDFFLIPIKRELDLARVIFIESRNDEYPEFKVKIDPARTYPFKNSGSHILGYISELSIGELRSLRDEGYRLGDNIGKSGLEKQYETFLKGKKGKMTVIKDNQGRIHEVLAEVKPDIGSTVYLTLDIDLQKYIEKIFKGYNGTVAVVDLKTGGILALMSKPDFNPESISGSIDADSWKKLINNPEKPLHNKFLQGYYSPGSVFKIVVALAGLQENVINKMTTTNCLGAVKIYDRVFHCWNKFGHGQMNIYNAIKNSCNIFFYQLGKKIDIDVIARFAGFLGFGKQTAIDLPNENKGLIPTKSWKLKTLNQKWFPGETISVAIGGGLIAVTPAQVLLMISTVALRGSMPQLHILDRIEKDGKVVKRFNKNFKNVPILKEYFETVIEGLFRVVNADGTGRSAKVSTMDICGKTGTQQIITKDNPNYKQLVKQKRFKPHSWFASFAPRNDPQIAMVVFVENGGDAGVIAAPIARKIYMKYFKK